MSTKDEFDERAGALIQDRIGQQSPPPSAKPHGRRGLRSWSGFCRSGTRTSAIRPRVQSPPASPSSRKARRDPSTTEERLDPHGYSAFLSELRDLCDRYRVLLYVSDGQVPRMHVELSDKPGFEDDDFRNGDAP